MIQLIRIALGAVAWGIGTSAGRELYGKVMRWAAVREEEDQPVEERIARMERDLEKLKAKRAESKESSASQATPETSNPEGQSGACP